MENRILVIGDEMLGGAGEAASRFAESLLCRLPNRPMQFSINAPTMLSLSQLLARSSADIIGKRAGRIIFALGLHELRRERGNGEKVFEGLQSLVFEMLRKTQAELFVLTLPPEMFPDDSMAVGEMNEAIRGMAAKDSERLKILDFAAQVEIFKEKQAERGKFARSLFAEDGNPTSLCITFLSMFLEDCILKELKI